MTLILFFIFFKIFRKRTTLLRCSADARYDERYTRNMRRKTSSSPMAVSRQSKSRWTMSKSIDYGWSYKSWPGFGTGLNVISRFRFSAPPTFRAHRREYSICEDSFVLYGGSSRSSSSSSSNNPVAIATKHMLPAVHSIYLATSSVRDAGRRAIRDAEGPRESFVLSRSSIGKVEQR